MERVIKLQMGLIHERLDRIERSYYKQPYKPPQPRRKEEISPLRDKKKDENFDDQFKENIYNFLCVMERKIRETQKCERKEMVEKGKESENKEKMEEQIECEREEENVGIEKEIESESTSVEKEEDIEGETKNVEKVGKESEKENKEKNMFQESNTTSKVEEKPVEMEKVFEDYECKEFVVDENVKENDGPKKEVENGLFEFDGVKSKYWYDDPFDIPSPRISPFWYINKLIIDHFIAARWSDWMDITCSTKFKVRRHCEVIVLNRMFVFKAVLKIRGRIFFKREGMMRTWLGHYKDGWRLKYCYHLREISSPFHGPLMIHSMVMVVS